MDGAFDLEHYQSIDWCGIWNAKGCNDVTKHETMGSWKKNLCPTIQDEHVLELDVKFV